MKTFILPLLLLISGTQFGHAVDVSFYGVLKAQFFNQTTNASPTLASSNAFSFNAFVVANTNYAVTNATVKPSNATPSRTLLSDDGGGSLRFAESFNSQAAMDAVYPTGSLFSPATYNVTMHTVNDSNRSVRLSFPTFTGYPGTPQIANLPAAQVIDTTIDFTLRWNSLGGTPLTIVQLLVFTPGSNLVFSTPAPFQTGALTYTSTQVIIPANTLPAGTNLEAHLIVANPNIPDTTSYSGAVGIAALSKDTSFPMATRGAPAQPRLEVLTPSGGQFQLRLAGEPVRTYQIQATGDFQTWDTLLTTNSASGVVNFTDSQSSGFTRRFYRGHVGQ